MKIKSYLTLSLSALLLAVPAISFAFSVVNGTKDTVTVSINGQCATGNVAVQTEAAIQDNEIQRLCNHNTDNCVGRIHKSENCGGLEIGSFVFDEDGSVKLAPVTHAQGYSVKPVVNMNLVAVGQK